MDRNEFEAKEFAVVDAKTSNADLVGAFEQKSRQLVAAYVEIARLRDHKMSASKCSDVNDVSKVFSQSIRAFLEWEDLKYSNDDPAHSPTVGDKDFTKLENSPQDLSKYIPKSKAVVEKYVNITESSQSDVITIDGVNDKGDVNKVFSHSARAFLAWADSRLQYTEEKPVRQL